MSNYYVLIVTGDSTYKENTLQEASKRDLIVEYVDTMEEALNSLLDKDYILVVIRADTVKYLPLINVMKRLKPMPVLVFSYVEPTEKVDACTDVDVFITSPYALDHIIESSYAFAVLSLYIFGGSGKGKTVIPLQLGYVYSISTMLILLFPEMQKGRSLHFKEVSALAFK